MLGQNTEHPSRPLLLPVSGLGNSPTWYWLVNLLPSLPCCSWCELTFHLCVASYCVPWLMTNHVPEEQRHCFLPTLKDGSVFYFHVINGQNKYHWIRVSEQLNCTRRGITVMQDFEVKDHIRQQGQPYSGGPLNPTIQPGNQSHQINSYFH